MNKVIMSGRLTKDPDYREIQQEIGSFHVANFDLAVRRNSKNVTDFFRVKTFNKIADNVKEYLHKGMRVLVEGELNITSYTDKETGEKKSYCEINASRVEFIDAKNGSENGSNSGGYPQPAPDGDDSFMSIPEGYEDLPFK